jgi:hypothetical protein
LFLSFGQHAMAPARARHLAKHGHGLPRELVEVKDAYVV